MWVRRPCRIMYLVFIQRPDGGSGSDDEDFMQPKHKRKAQLGVKVCDV